MKKNLGRQFRHFSLRRYPLILLESISYYLGWGLLLGTTSPFIANSSSWVGEKVVARTEAFAFLTSRIAIWHKGSGVGNGRNDSGGPSEYQSLSCGFFSSAYGMDAIRLVTTAWIIAMAKRTSYASSATPTLSLSLHTTQNLHSSKALFLFLFL